MIDDSERRMVAARLSALDTHKWYNAADEVDALETAIGCSIGQDWQDQNWWHRLAGLIDRPTCQMVECTIDNGSRSWGMRCTACGKEFEHMKSSYGWHYCPNCGMEIKK